jgi:hypothetical protein
MVIASVSGPSGTLRVALLPTNDAEAAPADSSRYPLPRLAHVICKFTVTVPFGTQPMVEVMELEVHGAATSAPEPPWPHANAEGSEELPTQSKEPSLGPADDTTVTLARLSDTPFLNSEQVVVPQLAPHVFRDAGMKPARSTTGSRAPAGR